MLTLKCLRSGRKRKGRSKKKCARSFFNDCLYKLLLLSYYRHIIYCCQIKLQISTFSSTTAMFVSQSPQPIKNGHTSVSKLCHNQHLDKKSWIFHILKLLQPSCFYEQITHNHVRMFSYLIYISKRQRTILLKII